MDVRNSKKILLTVLVFSVFFYSNICLALKTTYIKDTPYFSLKEIAKELGMRANIGSEFCTLIKDKSSMSFQNNKKNAFINSVEIYLLYPPVISAEQALISQKDYYNVILPILTTRAIKKQTVKTIIIDPGHGGKDDGAQGVFAKEKNVALSISQKVARILTSKGYRVIMTRNSDKFISLESRPAVIDRYKGDLFVSIHCNSANSSVSGYETFILAPAGTASTYSKKPVDNIEKGNAWDKNNHRLGFEIQKALKQTGRTDRGLKHARLSVLRNSTKPAALVEVGFLSNRPEEKLLASNAYQDKLASAIASGIIAYANSASKGN